MKIVDDYNEPIEFVVKRDGWEEMFTLTTDVFQLFGEVVKAWNGGPADSQLMIDAAVRVNAVLSPLGVPRLSIRACRQLIRDLNAHTEDLLKKEAATT